MTLKLLDLPQEVLIQIYIEVAGGHLRLKDPHFFEDVLRSDRTFHNGLATQMTTCRKIFEVISSTLYTYQVFRIYVGPPDEDHLRFGLRERQDEFLRLHGASIRSVIIDIGVADVPPYRCRAASNGNLLMYHTPNKILDVQEFCSPNAAAGCKTVLTGVLELLLRGRSEAVLDLSVGFSALSIKRGDGVRKAKLPAWAMASEYEIAKPLEVLNGWIRSFHDYEAFAGRVNHSSFDDIVRKMVMGDSEAGSNHAVQPAN
jgi:hypothetical protein